MIHVTITPKNQIDKQGKDDTQITDEHIGKVPSFPSWAQPAAATDLEGPKVQEEGKSEPPPGSLPRPPKLPASLVAFVLATGSAQDIKEFVVEAFKMTELGRLSLASTKKQQMLAAL